MRKLLVSILLAAGLVMLVGATPGLAAGHPKIDRCRGQLRTQVVQRAHHKNRVVRVCVPATKRLDLVVGLDGADNGYTVRFTFATVEPGPVVQFYDAPGHSVFSLLADRDGRGIGLGAQGHVVWADAADNTGPAHRVVVTVDPAGTATLYFDGQLVGSVLNYGDPTPTAIHLAIGGWDFTQAPGPGFAQAGLVYTGSVGKVAVVPGVVAP